MGKLKERIHKWIYGTDYDIYKDEPVLSWQSVAAEPDRIELCFQNDFGVNIRFKSYGEIQPSSQYYDSIPMDVNEELLTPAHYSRRDVSLESCTYNGKSALRMYAKIPTFDSGDRESDSWHYLLFFRETRNQIDALYCKGGYRVAARYICYNLVEVPEDVQSYLKELNIWR